MSQLRNLPCGSPPPTSEAEIVMDTPALTRLAIELERDHTSPS